ncbi:MAG: hypothetical protein VB078_07805 [Clostridiaceae bacterium]|nr:hypothetical protein [Clostridiaceae bacterium]
MKLPYLRTSGKAAQLTDSFLGLCLTEEYKNGCLCKGSRLSSDDSPGLCQRKTPRQTAFYTEPQGICVKDGLAVMHNGRVIYAGEDIGGITDGKKQTAVIGNKIVIFPDKLYIDTLSGKLMPMEEALTLQKAVFTSKAIAFGSEECPFSVGDGVEIAGCIDYRSNNLTLIIRGVEQNSLIFDEGAFEAGIENHEVTIKRRIPELEVICESGNRLWGCEGNTIYSSKLGDPLNFFVYDRLSTDAYALDVAGDGAFTACGQYSSHIVFFKEDIAYKLYGTRPANYQLMTARIPGVRRKCGRSLWTDSEDMYYLGRMGVYAYSGGVPELVSAALGEIEAEEACACVWKGKYYLSLWDGVKGETLTYDIAKGIWLPWGSESAFAFALSGGSMYMLERGGALLELDKGEEKEAWSAELRPFKDGTGRNTQCTSLIIDAEPEKGSWMEVYMSENGGPYMKLAAFDSTKRGLRPIMLPPNRGNRLNFKLEGLGLCRIYSIERRFRIGSES